MPDHSDTKSPADDTQRLQEAAQVLRELLARSRDGSVSTQAVRKEFEARNMAEPQELIARLKSEEVACGGGEDHPRWHHFGRSFYTEAKFLEGQRLRDADAAQAEAADDTSAEPTAADATGTQLVPSRPL